MKKTILTFFVLAFTVLFFTQSVNANAAEPPVITIVIPTKDSSVFVTLESNDEVIEGYMSRIKNETYARFYNSQLPAEHDYTFAKTVTLTFYFKHGLDTESFSIEKNLESRSYNQVYTLDVENRTLMEGKSLSRNLSLIGMRLSLTLLIEGLVFYILGYRHKRTWIAFVLINLFTQGWLNFDITFNWQPNSYLIFSFVVMEILILLGEWIVFLLTVKEGKKLKLVFTVFLANVLSLFVGGYLLLNFPV